MYKTAETSYTERKLCRVMESTNLMDQYTVAVQGNDSKVVGHLPMAKDGKFARTTFYFLKADKNVPVESMCLEKP